MEQNTITYHKWLRLQKYQPSSIRTLKSLAKQAKAHIYNWNNEAIKSYYHWTTEQGYSSLYLQQIQWGLWSYSQYLAQVHQYKIKLYLPKIKVQKNRRKALSPKEIYQVQEWIEDTQKEKGWNQVLWVLFYGCGLRKSEALKLRLKDVQIQNKLLYVRTAKGGKIRQIPLSEKQVKI